MSESLVDVLVNTSAFDAMQEKILKIARDDSIEVVGSFHGQTIQHLTSFGVDANGKVFHDYSDAYAKRLKIAKQPKTLTRGKGRLYNLVVEGNVLTVADEDNARVIAAGQMSGAGGRWSYTHDFLDVSDETNEYAGDALAEHVIENI